MGGDLLVKAAVSIALKTNLSPSLIGLTIIAIGTSAPEFITSLLAALRDSPDIAVGNVVGSNIFNILAILGISSLIKPNRVTESTLKIEWPFLMFATLLIFAFAWDGLYSRWDAFILVSAIYIFLAYSVQRARRLGKFKESEEKLKEYEDLKPLKSGTYDFLFLLGGFLALAGGAQLALDGGIQVGSYFGLSDRIIGLTIISVGTGLPELATSSVAAYRGRDDIALANVIGSNIVNSLGIIGHASLIFPMRVSPQILSRDFLWLIGCTLLVGPLMRSRTLARRDGLFLLIVYAIYIYFLIHSSPHVL